MIAVEIAYRSNSSTIIAVLVRTFYRTIPRLEFRDISAIRRIVRGVEGKGDI